MYFLNLPVQWVQIDECICSCSSMWSVLDHCPARTGGKTYSQGSAFGIPIPQSFTSQSQNQSRSHLPTPAYSCIPCPRSSPSFSPPDTGDASRRKNPARTAYSFRNLKISNIIWTLCDTTSAVFFFLGVNRHFRQTNANLAWTWLAALFAPVLFLIVKIYNTIWCRIMQKQCTIPTQFCFISQFCFPVFEPWKWNKNEWGQYVVSRSCKFNWNFHATLA